VASVSVTQVAARRKNIACWQLSSRSEFLFFLDFPAAVKEDAGEKKKRTQGKVGLAFTK